MALLDGGKIGFLGAGMMAEAIARGLIRAGVSPTDISAYDPDQNRRDVFGRDLGISIAGNCASVASSSDITIVAVKPQMVGRVLEEIGIVVKSDQLLISIAAGITTDFIESKLSHHVPVVRVMPNTPCLIGEGATAIAPGKYADERHMDIATQIFSDAGKVARVVEDKMDAVTGLSGSGPAYVYTFIEALADGGVSVGLPRDVARLLAAQTVAGAAKMVLESGKHTAELRDKVITPGGTTAAGMASLEASGFRSAVMEAVASATKRSSELGKHK